MALTRRIQEVLTQRCYVRREGGAGGGDGGARVPTHGQLDGWVYDPMLRCRWVRHEVGARCGRAEFDVISDTGGVLPFDAALRRYGRNDQVKVVVDPADDPGQTDVGGIDFFGGGGDVGAVLFEGVLMRQASAVRGDGQGADERSRLVAWPMPVLDNDHPDHLVRGRWTRLEEPTEEDSDLSTQQLVIVETPALPAVFNFAGRPNRKVGIYQVPIANSDYVLRGSDWTHDDDPGGEYWTVRQAINALLAVCLFGVGGADDGAEDVMGAGSLPRHVSIEHATLEGLTTNVGDDLAGTRFDGLDQVLPEVSIQGLGVFDALEAVCDAADFAFALEAMSDAERRADGHDRRYALRLWRRQNGPLVHFDLPARGRNFGGNAAALLREANMPRINGVVDASGVTNECQAVAPVLIETTVELKPMWAGADELHDAAIDADLQGPFEEEDLADDESYAGRHVAGGAAFEEHGHVGRAWGLDLIGGEITGYDSGSQEAYAHDPDGFDWVAHLQLDDPEGPAAPLYADRQEDLGESEAQARRALTTWLKRRREVMPLLSREAVERGHQLILEVSEDEGATWSVVPVKFNTLEDQFGVLMNVPNLAKVSVATLGTEEDPEPEDSWWALIADLKLRVRLTCVIEADFALRFDSPRGGGGRRAGSPVVYRRAQWRAPDLRDAWVASGSHYHADDEADWKRPMGRGLDPSAALADYATRHRQATEQVRWSLSGNTFLMELGVWKLGQRVDGVRGRGIRFECGGGRRPNIVGIRYNLATGGSGGGGQSIELSLSDQRFAGGR